MLVASETQSRSLLRQELTAVEEGGGGNGGGGGHGGGGGDSDVVWCGLSSRGICRMCGGLLTLMFRLEVLLVAASQESKQAGTSSLGSEPRPRKQEREHEVRARGTSTQPKSNCRTEEPWEQSWRTAGPHLLLSVLLDHYTHTLLPRNRSITTGRHVQQSTQPHTK